MPRTPDTKGTCAFCGQMVTKRTATNHLEKCPKWVEKNSSAQVSDRPVENLWQLRIQDAYRKEYWIIMEMAGSATLTKLDQYLRDIWLECCGHLSQFTIGGWGGQEIGKARKADMTFAPGMVLRHLYDFGTTSETDIHVIGMRRGVSLIKKPITLIARNIQPEAPCQVCGQPAAALCMECVYEENQSGYLCAEHIQGHLHNQYGEPVGVYNSPRMGLCGYDGPAEPPY